MKWISLAAAAAFLICLAPTVSAAPPWMPEYDLRAQRVNVGEQASAQRTAVTEEASGSLPDLEDEPRVGRRAAPTVQLRGRNFSFETASSQKVSVYEEYAAEMPDLELEDRVAHRSAVSEQISGERVDVSERPAAQFPTPGED